MIFLEIVRAVEFVLNIRRHCMVQLSFHGRQIVVHGICQALWEERPAIKLEQILLDQAAHDV